MALSDFIQEIEKNERDKLNYNSWDWKWGVEVDPFKILPEDVYGTDYSISEYNDYSTYSTYSTYSSVIPK